MSRSAGGRSMKRSAGAIISCVTRSKRTPISRCWTCSRAWAPDSTSPRAAGWGLEDVGRGVTALERVLDLAGELMDDGVALEHIDMGGGLGIRYADETPPEPYDYVLALLSTLERYGARYQRLRLLIEPGKA